MLLKTAQVLDAFDGRAQELAAEILRSGGLVVFPTETVYGLGADSNNPLAVARIFEAKGRPRFDPLIVHISSPDEARRHGRFPEEPSRRLMARFWPGPLTLVVAKDESVPEIVTAGLDTVALRIPAHPAALALIRSTGRAIAAPSANLFGSVSPTEANHVVNQLGNKVDLILDGGKCSVGLESTILSLTGPTPTILRAGGISREDLEEVLGSVELCTQSSDTPRAPGQLTRHYATRTPLKILKNARDAETNGPGARVGLVSLAPPSHPERYEAVEVLSPSGDLREAASNLFAALHRLDSLSLDLLVAHPVKETGLGAAIMDRLRRCAAAAPQNDKES